MLDIIVLLHGMSTMWDTTEKRAMAFKKFAHETDGRVEGNNKSA